MNQFLFFLNFKVILLVLAYSSVENNVAELSSGIVTRVSETFIVVAFEETFESDSIDDDRLMRLTRLANDVTFKRMKRFVGQGGVGEGWSGVGCGGGVGLGWIGWTELG